MLTKEKIIEKIEKVNHYRVKVISIKGNEKDFVDKYKAFAKNHTRLRNIVKNKESYRDMDDALTNEIVDKLNIIWKT